MKNVTSPPFLCVDFKTRGHNITKTKPLQLLKVQKGWMEVCRGCGTRNLKQEKFVVSHHEKYQRYDIGLGKFVDTSGNFSKLIQS